MAGTSRPLSVSITSSIGAVTGAAIAGAPDPRQAATTLAFYCIIFLIIAWLARVGYVADLISAPVLTGFKIGMGISIAVGQLDSLLGVSIDDDRVAVQLWPMRLRRISTSWTARPTEPNRCKSPTWSEAPGSRVPHAVGGSPSTDPPVILQAERITPHGDTNRLGL